MARARSRLIACCAALVGALALGSCAGFGNRQAAPASGLGPSQQRREPALSGNGRLLASIVDDSGRSSVLLQEQPSGRVIPLRHLRGHRPHSSPALSWNGRYLALLLQQGGQSVAVIEDRLSGQLHRLPAPGGAKLERLSLAPDGQTLALQVLQGGQQRVQLFDLSGVLEPDRPGGQRSSNPTAP